MADEIHAVPVPEDVTLVTLNGELSFTCCGLTQATTGSSVTHVKCVRCQFMYTFVLTPARLSPGIFSTGTLVRLKEDVRTVVGCRQDFNVPAGEYQVFEDTHGAMGTLEDETLLCVESKGQDTMRTLLAPVPNALLEIVEITNGDSDGRQEVDS